MRLKALRAGVVTLAILVFGLTAAITAAGYAYDDAGETIESVDNETVAVDYSNQTKLANADIALEVYDNETVVNSSGTTLTEGDDYELYTNGSIEWYDTGNTVDGEAVDVSYHYRAKVRVVRTMHTVVSPLLGGLPYAILIGAALSLFGGVGSLIYAVRKMNGRFGKGGLGR